MIDIDGSNLVEIAHRCNECGHRKCRNLSGLDDENNLRWQWKRYAIGLQDEFPSGFAVLDGVVFCTRFKEEKKKGCGKQ